MLRRLSPPQLFIGSFVVLILLGYLGLLWLPGIYTGEPLSHTDAFFTATSAVCVTGLIVADTSKDFTWFGQLYLLVLIQIGGLGMLTFTSLIMIALGRRLTLREEELSSTLDSTPHINARLLVRDVVRFTFAIEAIGAVLLFACWAPQVGPRNALWPAIFHSVSAFCNAGFSTYPDSLMGFQHNWPSLCVIMALIVVGGLGFLTLEEIYQRHQAKQAQKTFRLSIHSRLVLITSLALTLGGWILFAVFEWNASLAALAPGHKITNALFMSVTARTAGFNSINYAAASDSGNFLTILLMSIGGSPGSTAGGIKTTSFALLGILAWSRLRGDETTNYAGRSLREETTDRAIGLFVIAAGIVVAGVFSLNALEHFHSGGGRFLHWMFEAVSAFNTVGLSMGVTYELSTPGRWMTILLMFLGRVGPLTITAALTTRRVGTSGFRFAYEDVMVG